MTSLDTRKKIVESVPAGCDTVEGCFDPLLAAHAVQLEAMKSSRPLAVIIREPGDGALLDARARAELVAALRCVDFVTIGGPPAAAQVTEDRPAFLELIRAKHGA